MGAPTLPAAPATAATMRVAPVSTSVSFASTLPPAGVFWGVALASSTATGASLLPPITMVRVASTELRPSVSV